MKASERRKIILTSLPLMDTGGPVMVRIPADDWEEERRKSKAQTKARELRRPSKNHNWYGRSFDGRQDLIHLVKLGLVKRERNCSGGRANRTYFVPVEKVQTPLELYRLAAESLSDFMDSLPQGWLGQTSGDIGSLNNGFIALRKAREAEKAISNNEN